MSWLKPFTRKHAVSDEDLSAYVDRQLPSESARMVEAHVETCDICRTKLAELRSVKALLSELPQPQPRRSFALTPAMAGAAAPVAARRPLGGLVLAPAASLALLVALVAVDAGSFAGGGSDETATLADKASDAQSEAFSAPEAPAAAQLSPAPTTVARSIPGTGEANATGGAAAAGGTPPAVPGQPAPSVAGADRSADDGAAEERQAAASEDDDGVPAIRLLQAAALAAFLISAGYLWYRWRGTADTRSA